VLLVPVRASRTRAAGLLDRQPGVGPPALEGPAGGGGGRRRLRAEEAEGVQRELELRRRAWARPRPSFCTAACLPCIENPHTEQSEVRQSAGAAPVSAAPIQADEMGLGCPRHSNRSCSSCSSSGGPAVRSELSAPLPRKRLAFLSIHSSSQKEVPDISKRIIDEGGAVPAPHFALLIVHGGPTEGGRWQARETAPPPSSRAAGPPALDRQVLEERELVVLLGDVPAGHGR
jgi:hypothetical protein